MVFVCGIHGVGKTEYCKKIAMQNKLKVFSASRLILNRLQTEYINKRVQDISENQKVLIEEISKLQKVEKNFILDGHLCLLNQKNCIERISMDVFKALKIKSLIVLVDSPSKIKERIERRDYTNWDINLIKKFQNEEIKYAKRLSKQLQIDMEILTVSKKGHEECPCFSDNIILPIKPIFAEEILKGNKKYEYRKQICSKNIDKIYLYETAPVKKIVGEVEVIAMLTMQKDRLWELTKKYSGIKKEYYKEYFEKSDFACAYRLGNVIQYKDGILLEDVGIHYVPQSYVYVNELSIEKV